MRRSSRALAVGALLCTIGVAVEPTGAASANERWAGWLGDGSRLDTMQVGVGGEPAISGDGDAIAYVAADGIRVYEVGRQHTRLVTANLGAHRPMWSRDGRDLLYYSNGQRGERSTFGIWVVDLKGMDSHQIYASRRDQFNPVWTATGKRVCWKQDDGVWVGDLAGTRNWEPLKPKIGEVVTPIDWSPETGELLLCRSDSQGDHYMIARAVKDGRSFGAPTPVPALIGNYVRMTSSGRELYAIGNGFVEIVERKSGAKRTYRFAPFNEPGEGAVSCERGYAVVVFTASSGAQELAIVRFSSSGR